MSALDFAQDRSTDEVKSLNAVIRGEISAVETYDQALARFGTECAAAELHHIRDEHEEAVDYLRGQVAEFCGDSDHGSSSWGVFAAAVTSTANAIGMATVLQALKEGELHGISQYESMLANDEVHAECKNIIRSRLLPNGRAHVLTLDHLLGGK